MPEPHEDLARELRELGTTLRTPPPPDVREAVRARLSTTMPARRRPARHWWAAAAAAVLAAVVLLLVPPVRTAAAQAATAVLRFAGIVVDRTPGAAPPASPAPLPSTGVVTLDEARRLAAFTIAVPARLGPPPTVEVADPDPAGRPRVVTLLYRSGALRLDEFDGRLDPFFAKKSAMAGLTWTDVNGAQALWIPSPHTVSYIDRYGATHDETARLAGATLIWEHGSVTCRLEGDLTMDEALAIARSMP